MPPSSSIPIAFGVAATIAGGAHVDIAEPVAARLDQTNPTISFASNVRLAANGTSLTMHMVSELMGIAGVDGAYRCADSEDGIEVVVAAKRHGLVDRERLLASEDRLAAVAGKPVSIRVVAHQGRSLGGLAGRALLFERG